MPLNLENFINNVNHAKSAYSFLPWVFVPQDFFEKVIMRQDFHRSSGIKKLPLVFFFLAQFMNSL